MQKKKKIDLKQLGPSREFDFYYYSFSENQNHLSIYVGKKKTYRLFTIYKTFPKNLVGKYQEYDFLGRSSRKSPGATEHLKR